MVIAYRWDGVLGIEKQATNFMRELCKTWAPEPEKTEREAAAFSVAHRAPRQSQVTRDVPEHLCKDGASFFASMRQAHELEGPASVAILTRAAECVDRIAAARASIAKDGAIIENQYGVAKMNPACTLEKSARDGFFAAMRLLGIDMSAGSTSGPFSWER